MATGYQNLAKDEGSGEVYGDKVGEVMKLKDLLDLWRNSPDVEKVVEVERREHTGGVDLLYHIYFWHENSFYGRHAALRVRIDYNGEVIEHDIFNVQLDPRQSVNWIQATNSWFDSWSLSRWSTSTGSFGSVYR